MTAKSFPTPTGLLPRFRGKKGSQVKVTYERKNETKTVSLVRAKWKSPVFMQEFSIPATDIQITAFEKTTAEQFATELAGFENKKVPGLIIDLRGNPGGLMDPSVEIADLLPRNVILCILRTAKERRNIII